jgi:hypothetical protein
MPVELNVKIAARGDAARSRIRHAGPRDAGLASQARRTEA